MKEKQTNNTFSRIALVVIAAVYLCTICIPNRFTEPKRVICWDIKSYYTYLPAYFIDHNIELYGWKDDKPAFEQKYWPIWLGGDTCLIKTSMGVSFFYAPFFAIAHLIAAPLGYPADGFSFPYAFALLLSGALFAWLGLLVLSKLLRRHFSDKVTAATIVLLGLFTNLYWYATFEAPMSHAYSFFLFASFLYLTELWYEGPSWKYSILIGLVFGLISLVRPSNSLIVVAFLFYGITTWKNIPEHFLLYLKEWPKILAIIVVTILIWIPQCLYWKHITGNFFFYSYCGERFYWTDPRWWQVLFGFRKGLFIYTPVLLAALAGYPLLWKRLKGYFWSILVFSIFNVYIISSWWCWWFGGSFGHRAFIDSYALLAIPLALSLTWIFEQKRWLKVCLSTLLVALALQATMHTIQYYNEVINYEGMNKKAYFHFFWKTSRPDDYWNYIKLPDLQQNERIKY